MLHWAKPYHPQEGLAVITSPPATKLLPAASPIAAQTYRSAKRLRLLILIKTSIGGQWLIPLAGAAVSSGHDVRVLLPDPDGPLGSAWQAAVFA